MIRTVLTFVLVVSFGRSASAEFVGRVRFDGPPPKTEPLDFRTDPVCSALGDHPAADHTLVGPNGGLANVFVYVVNPPIPRTKTPPKSKKSPVILDQHACRYAPKVFGILVGQPLEIRNGDPTLHTTHAFTYRGFNVVTPRQGQRIRKVFTRRQIMVPIRCDVHPWMTAYAGVLEHAYFAVSDATGRFVIPSGLPNGRYTLAFWHEKLGRQRVAVKLVDGRATTEIVFQAADPG